jgi:hypothetical protein
MKKLLIFFMAAMVIFSTISACGRWFIFYHKPEYRGRVINAETKAPIEGAVVVVMYHKQFIMGLAESGKESIMKVKETLTDSKGEFYFPSDTGLMPFFSTELFSAFIIYKPGYMYSNGDQKPDSHNQWGLSSAVLIEKYFSSDVIGKVEEIRAGYDHWKGPLGILELQRAKTRKDRLLAMPAPPGDYTSKELPLFVKIINEESKNLSLEGGYK